MINFLRKIRRRILKPNNTRKYILYAFGEIVLIVIGILIALQINNWNIKKKNQSLELDLLREIRLDFIADTTQFRNRYYVAYNDLIKSIMVYDSTMKLDQKEINITMRSKLTAHKTRRLLT